MTPGTTLLILIWVVDKYKGQPGAGIALTIILGLLGLIILACLPRTSAIHCMRRRLVSIVSRAAKSGPSW
jgi:hypothetical protein